MISVEQFMDIKHLHDQGLSLREIARHTGHSRNTVRKVLRGEHTLKVKPHDRASKLEPFHDYLRQRFQEYGLSGTRLMEEIRAMGYHGSVVTVRRFLRTLKADVVRHRRLTVRFETAPGHQAQADWAYCGKFPGPDGKLIPVYVFVMVLSYSRMLFVQFTNSMRMRELVACHQAAFDFFGGWTRTILYDNMKQVRTGPARMNEQFLDFARHYGFTPKTHRPYRARTKGKVERIVDYVKKSFLAGRVFHGMQDLNDQSRRWLDSTANARIHGTTQRVPQEAFTEEREQLIPLAGVPKYQFLDPVSRTVNWESMVQFRGSRYSVPPEFAGKQVEVTAHGGQIFVRAGDLVIAEHHAAVQPGQSIVNRDHLAELWKITARQVEPPPRTAWQMEFTDEVERLPLSSFDQLVMVGTEVLS